MNASMRSTASAQFSASLRPELTVGLKLWSPALIHSSWIAVARAYVSTSARLPKLSRSPCRISVGVARPARCSVRSCCGLPGGWKG